MSIQDLENLIESHCCQLGDLATFQTLLMTRFLKKQLATNLVTYSDHQGKSDFIIYSKGLSFVFCAICRQEHAAHRSRGG